ncbi:CD209 antigen-like protein E isoform X1 [Seriola dumerili]|uniref:CD209 antigen-like protein E isoform X1 n=1 Tax=Seriola dumerili TaxID=41447 RepID=UPI000BBEA3B6|nr:CD209 antigen-like protein E isoform X1 [Seriola dumerili]
MEYINYQVARSVASKRHTGEDSAAVTPVMSGRKLYTLVGVSFGLLCVLQAALNISLRYALYTSDNKPSGIEASCKNLTEELDYLKRKLINFDHNSQQGWVYFYPSFYYISSTKKSWHDSRDDCLQRGADLVIINSKEEQDFTRKFHKITWIGLSDRETEGIWKWVDGTPITKSYWANGEPNSYEGKNEDCVEIRFPNEENSWNDIPCEGQNFWICEKTMAL